jgi:hypothetical protein
VADAEAGDDSDGTPQLKACHAEGELHAPAVAPAFPAPPAPTQLPAVRAPPVRGADQPLPPSRAFPPPLEPPRAAPRA